MEKLFSYLLISTFLLIMLLVGYYLEKVLQKRNTKLIIGNTAYEVLKDTPDEIWVGGKRLVLSQMKDIIESCKNTHKQIVFWDGNTTLFGKRYAIFANGIIRYVSGKEIKFYTEEK